MNTLFNIPPKQIALRREKCKSCIHCQKWECNSKHFFYCAARKSNRTSNGLLKIKANQQACDNYKHK